MRLLLVEDDPKISKFLENGLAQTGYTVDLAIDGEIAQQFLGQNDYDLVVSDIMLPKIDGLTLIENFRKKDQKTPVLFLSAKRSIDDRILGLQLGADDYMIKPFSLSELLARVQALLRRSNALTSKNTAPATSTLIAADIVFDLISRKVKRNNKAIELQLKELSLLEYFLRNPGKVLSKTQILEAIWNYQFDPQTNVVDVLVFRLRAKIDRDFDKKLIQNIRGVGYIFQPD